MPGLMIGDKIPDLEADSTHGKIKIHDFMGYNWAILFSHPDHHQYAVAQYRWGFLLAQVHMQVLSPPVCTSELGMTAAYSKEFAKRSVKVLGLSYDNVQSNKEWIKQMEPAGCKVTYPILADPNGDIIKQLNMVDPDEKDSSGKPMPSCALHIVSPDKIIKLSFLYPASMSQNMDEVVRVLYSLQKAMKHKVATPADHCKPGGEPVVISPSVPNQQAKEMFPPGFDTDADLPSKSNVI